jgi:hypothetical protein
MSVDVFLWQHPVGQGGMHTGRIGCGAEQFRWMYDCGSNQVDALHREIRLLSTGSQLDLLFLSHLDSDHVRGIDTLLTSVQVREVVLPYLNDAERILAIARDIEGGTLSGTFLEFAEDPAGWLIGRGVSTVTLLDGSDDDGALGPSDPSFSPGGPEEHHGPVNFKWFPRPTGERRRRGGAVVRRLRAGAMGGFQSSTGQIPWVLVPFAQMPSKARLVQFKRALKAEFPASRKVEDFAAAAKTAQGRDKLRSCYDRIWSNHNLVSLSLYAGPSESAPNVWQVYENNHPQTRPSVLWRRRMHYLNDMEQPGWLSTGDAHLGRVGRRRMFLQRYSPFAQRVGVLVVPHHGAGDHFHEDVIAKLSNVSYGIAASGPNGYNHPHPIVSQTIRHFCCFHQVSDSEETGFGLIASLP